MSKWIDYLKYLMEFHSVTSSARDDRNARSTALYWLGKVFMVLDGIQGDVVLKSRVCLNETFFKVVRGDVRKKDGKELRGISRNRICVGVLTDSDSFVAIAENVSKPSKKSTFECLGPHIRPGSILDHDGDNSHSPLVGKLQLTSEVHTTAETKEPEDKDNPLEPVSSMHPLMKRFMRRHGGYRREDLRTGWI